ncbi:chaperonin GroES [Marchantia polymorpha subsp. ruderalis]|uniref:Uncharacterized protein n=2 Tax=Marchantia polymorpha TaxID=3197 RepID=A0A176WJJ2_MARPO|nr:hypothetical protein AXG93_3017s1260 [Marchantia polymorpha subsp. ruderalis]PTQ27851.1 hypothetical protein MARPO_0181s0002 [Marchantia polymorpha]BBN03624.1 hypothetical protein Mp_2g24950 [Marchantia polymorpha subsp. ruderalis]|eukprot:PTQ27851.1 hypothetical protein MARPO_0181s0002 [Marchantia polymorpha]
MAAMVNAVATTRHSSVVAAPLSSAAVRSSSASSSLAFKSCTRSSPKLVARRTAVVRAAVDVSKIVPQADRILIKLESLAETTSGGVLLPKSAVKFERYLLGEVLAVGADVKNTEKGKKVLVADINAYEVNLGTLEKLCFARASDLLAEVQ